MLLVCLAFILTASPTEQVARVLDDWPLAASHADEATYVRTSQTMRSFSARTRPNDGTRKHSAPLPTRTSQRGRRGAFERRGEPSRSHRTARSHGSMKTSTRQTSARVVA